MDFESYLKFVRLLGGCSGICRCKSKTGKSSPRKERKYEHRRLSLKKYVPLTETGASQRKQNKMMFFSLVEIQRQHSGAIENIRHQDKSPIAAMSGDLSRGKYQLS